MEFIQLKFCYLSFTVFHWHTIDLTRATFQHRELTLMFDTLCELGDDRLEVAWYAGEENEEIS